MMRKRAKTATLPELAFFAAWRSPVVAIALACISIFLIASPPLHGRDRSIPKDYALIFGTVWGPDDLPVAGMKVKIRKADDKDGKARWEVYSNSRGEFEQRLPVGKQQYIIWADVRGYKSRDGRHLQPGPEVRVMIQNNERADTGLHLQ
jgi:hypothetical protein